MSKDYEIIVDAHPNIYNDMSERKLRICFSEPNNGVSNETGILMLIPGFGGNVDSNVYKKMRSIFADDYNFVTIQCDYFGIEFMQNEIKKETIESFNDMGPLQAMDIISSVTIVKEILEDNDLVYDENKIIVYGHSHGAYLAYLSNILSPDLWHLIIDNSSWLTPVYLFSNRYLKTSNGETKIFDYQVKRMEDFDSEIYDLRLLYKKLNHRSHILSFHGNNDNLISLEDKRNFILPLKNSSLFEITECLV